MPSLAEVGQLAQVVSTVGTLVAVGCTIYIAEKARKEVREDRRLRTHPVVVVESGPNAIAVERGPFSHRIPGYDPNAVEEAFKNLPADGLRLNSKPFGKVVNVGLGPAISVRITFIPHLIKTEDDEFKIDSEKLNEPRYSRRWNGRTISNDLLSPGSSGQILGLPTFLTLDLADNVRYAEGVMEISYRDIYDTPLCTVQKFRYFNKAKEPRYTITIADIVSIPK